MTTQNQVHAENSVTTGDKADYLRRWPLLKSSDVREVYFDGNSHPTLVILESGVQRIVEHENNMAVVSDIFQEDLERARDALSVIRDAVEEEWFLSKLLGTR